MRILLYCNTTQESINSRLGTPDYSYWYVLDAFRALLGRLGTVECIDDPTLADPIWRTCRDNGESCVLLSFAPPHKTPLGLECPTIPVFAWEYPNLPRLGDELSWLQDPRNDWADVFRQVAGAIPLSRHTRRAVLDALGEDYPATAIPTPSWHRYADLRQRIAARAPLPEHRVLRLRQARVVDSHLLGLNADGMINPDHDDGTPFAADDDQLLPPKPVMAEDRWYDVPRRSLPADAIASPASLQDALPGENDPVPSGWALPPPLDIRMPLEGVVYTSVLTPSDGRKNWEDMLTAFAWAFRDVEDAVLVLKLGGVNLEKRHHEMVALLSKLAPFRCRIVAIHGYIDAGNYEDLIAASDFYVNASRCEGLCMPLLEYLCAGIPAIAPDHTAMADYIDGELAFVVASSDGEPTVWPHGDYTFNRTTRHRIDWHSLMLGLRASYVMAKARPEEYVDMSARAVAKMHDYCGDEAVERQLSGFLARIAEAIVDGKSNAVPATTAS
ncbi:glycosyltransferase [Pseudoxanthomonas gei]|nr:glycosyltransferase [Pseudoxanthomonas gei]